MTNRKDNILKLAKGFYGRNKVWKMARNRVHHGLQHAYRDRKNKKRIYKRLWVTQINASTNELGVKYSQFMEGLAASGSQLNRKMVSELAQYEPMSMRSVVELSNTSRKAVAAYHEQMRQAEQRDEKELRRGYLDSLKKEYGDDLKYIDFPEEGSADYVNPLDTDHEKMIREHIGRALNQVAEDDYKEQQEHNKKLKEELIKRGTKEEDIEVDDIYPVGQ